jgi:hypothetical protein
MTDQRAALKAEIAELEAELLAATDTALRQRLWLMIRSRREEIAALKSQVRE